MPMGLLLTQRRINIGGIRPYKINHIQMKHVLFTLMAIGGLSALFAGCAKDPGDHITAEESRVYTTNHDSAVNFSSYSTYKLEDSVLVVDGNNSAKQLTAIDQAYINAVKKYMDAAGYTEVSGSATADLGVSVNRVYNRYTGYFSYDAYWGGFGGFWDPGFYWGYPGYGYGYPGFFQSYTVTDVAVIVDILDLKNAAANKQLNHIWIGTINGYGIASNSNTGIADSQVQALFDQSAYLKK